MISPYSLVFHMALVRALEMTMYGVTTRKAEPASIYAKGSLIDKESPLDGFIMRETETKGEYQLVQNQSLSS